MLMHGIYISQLLLKVINGKMEEQRHLEETREVLYFLGSFLIIYRH